MKLMKRLPFVCCGQTWQRCILCGAFLEAQLKLTKTAFFVVHPALFINNGKAKYSERLARVIDVS